MPEVNIISAVDNNYILPLLVMLNSAKNNSSSEILLTVGFDSAELSVESRNLISSVLTLINVNHEYLEVSLTSEMEQIFHITPTAYSRLLMADKITGIALWLDADLICLPNWDSIVLNEQNQLNGLPIAAVRDSGITKEVLEGTKNQSLILAGYDYFNSGVSIIDCDRWKELGYPLTWTEAIKNAKNLGFQWADQCVLNWICHQNVKYLPQNYNVLVGLRKHSKKSKPLIMHFAGGSKPWFYSIFDPRILLGVLFPKDVYKYLFYQNSLVRKISKKDKNLGTKLKIERKKMRRKLNHPKFRSAAFRLMVNLGQKR